MTTKTAKTKTPTADTAQSFERVAELYESMTEQTLRLGRVMASGFERSIQEQIDLMEAAFEAARPLAAVKQPGDFLGVQMDVVKGLNQRAVASATNQLKIQQETGTELKDAVLEGMQSVASVVPKAA